MNTEIDGKRYYINIDEVFRLVEYSDKVDKKELEITDGYEYGEGDSNGKLVPVSKIVREVKSPVDSQIDNIRYDFIKFLITQVVGTDVLFDGEMSDTISFGTDICIESLVRKGILVEITE